VAGLAGAHEDVGVSRLLVTLSAGADPAPVADGLRALGAVRVAGPRAALPDVVVADFDDASPARDDLVAAVRTVPGVASAEPEVLRWSSSPPDRP
jgi:hypothetical protein